MSAGRHFREGVEQELHALDGVLDGVAMELARIRRLEDVDADAIGHRVQRAALRAQTIRRQLIEAAEQHGVAAAFADRGELTALIGELERVIAERHAAAPKARLRALADV